jgi:hypothetical protein
METTTEGNEMSSNWTNYRETVYGTDEAWVRQNIIQPAVAADPTVAPWDNWRIVKHNGGLQAQISRDH